MISLASINLVILSFLLPKKISYPLPLLPKKQHAQKNQRSSIFYFQKNNILSFYLKKKNNIPKISDPLSFYFQKISILSLFTSKKQWWVR